MELAGDVIHPVLWSFESGINNLCSNNTDLVQFLAVGMALFKRFLLVGIIDWISLVPLFVPSSLFGFPTRENAAPPPSQKPDSMVGSRRPLNVWRMLEGWSVSLVSSVCMRRA